MNEMIWSLTEYALRAGLIRQEDRIWAVNRLLEVLQLESAERVEPLALPLHEILSALTQDAVRRGIVEDTLTDRELFDTRLMGVLTPPPHEVRDMFRRLYAQQPQRATDWFYRFSQDTNYIRRDRIARDQRWTYEGKYGILEITINLSKPEKDPREIAAARLLPQSDYPKCQLCAENEGYAGHRNHPARQNHRIIPIRLQNADWYLQYSPYVYYQEHCIAFHAQHTPMRIDRTTFAGLLDFVTLFPHYFIGSNADLPIVGGSILNHDHFQGGRHDFAMAKMPIETPLQFAGFPEVEAGIVRWPMSVLRLRGRQTPRLIDLADKILRCWREYTDESAMILAETDGIPHNTVTPIARKNGECFELDLVLRNNLKTPEHPLGLYHPHKALHHIKKENIGLIEVMGLAVLPARLKRELSALGEALIAGRELHSDPLLEKHADWAEELKARYRFTAENVEEILQQEVGAVFEQVLEDAAVYRRTETGRQAFLRFTEYVNYRC